MQPQEAAQLAHDIASLNLEDLRAMLRCRRLGSEGSRAELAQRLGAFLASPASFPEADCRPRPVVQLGGRLFAGRQQLRSHCQLLLALLEGEEVEAGHPDWAFLSALLQQHPRYADKVAPPVQRFRVRAVQQQDMATYRMFEFRDQRGQEWADFSYRKCIGLDPGHNADLTFRDAMRWAVGDQLAAYRAASAQVGSGGRPVWRCDCCGRRVAHGGKLRLEHAEPSFHQLVRSFCDGTSLRPPPVDGRVPGTNRGCFTDEAWVAAWRAFHRRNARRLELRCIPCAQQLAQQDGGGQGWRAASASAS